MILKNTITSTNIVVTFTEADLIDVLATRVPGMASLDPALFTIEPEMTDGVYNGGGVKLIYNESAQVGEDIP